MSPSNAPTATFSSDSPTICSVSATGQIGVPGPADGYKGDCLVRISAPAAPGWAAVDEVLTVPLGGPAIILTLSGTIDRSPVWPADAESIAVAIDGNLSGTVGGPWLVFGASGAGNCSVTNPNGPGSFSLVVTLHSPIPCTVDFYVNAAGTYHYTSEVPPPVVITPVTS